jgi:hypothetical protein
LIFLAAARRCVADGEAAATSATGKCTPIHFNSNALKPKIRPAAGRRNQHA